MADRLTRAFFDRPAPEVARDLLGCTPVGVARAKTLWRCQLTGAVGVSTYRPAGRSRRRPTSQ